MDVDVRDGDHVAPADAVWPGGGPRGTGPLSGLRVLDLTAYAVGPWAAANLAQLGADVVRVDPPYGDPIRAVLPRKEGEPTTYMSTSLGKRSIVLDLKDPQDHALVLRLAGAADVVLENSRAGTMDRLGLGFAELSRRNRRLVYCSSSSYGDAGPLASMGSTDPQGQAFSGFASHNGSPGGAPEVLRYVALVDLGTSMQLLSAVLVGLVARRRTGRGSYLRTSQMEGAIGLQLTRFAEFFASGTAGAPLGSESASVVPSAAFRTSDGVDIAVSVTDEQQWDTLCDVLRLDGAVARLGAADRLVHRTQVHDAVRREVSRRPAAWWTQVLSRHGIPCARFRSIDEKPGELTHFVENDMVRRVRLPRGGTLAVAGPMWHFESTPAQLGDPEVPGAHTEELTAQIRNADPLAEPAASPADDGSSAGTCLNHLTVVDATQGVAGPYCSLLLATLGADVIKVEPSGGDWLRRTVGPAVDGTAAAAYALNRGKRSVELSPDDAEGRATLRDLIRGADVFLHDLTAAEAEARGLTPAQLRELNPDLLDCSVTAYGEKGPWCDVPASELEVQATSGVWRYLGVVGEPPLRIGADVTGLLGGSAAFQAVMAALAGDRRGQHVSTSQLAATTGANTVMIAALDDPDAWEGFHTNAATYPPDHGIATADGRIYYGQPLRSEDAWVQFCREIGADTLLEVPEFATRELRMPNQMMLRQALQTFFLHFSTEELVEKVVRSDGIAVPVQDLSEVVEHPQVSSLDIVVDAAAGRALAPPWRAADGSIRPMTEAAPAVGADTRAVLERFTRTEEAAHGRSAPFEADREVHPGLSTALREGTR